MSNLIPPLATKLYIPPGRPTLMPRPRLTDRLAKRLTRPLTLVSAPAGFGKATLLAGWLRWRLWAYAVAALQTLAPGLGEMALALLQSPPPPPVKTQCVARARELKLV